MKKPTGRRVLAFIIDILIVSFISSAISSIKFINPTLDKYNESYEQYEKYINEKLTPEEAQNIMNSEEYQNLTYNLKYTGRYTSLITLIVSFLYFVVLQYYTKGYTGGKKLLNIKVESEEKELKFYQLLLRSFIINSLLTSGLSLIAVSFLSKESYFSVEIFIEVLDMGLLFLSFGMMLYRQDGKGLHDLIANTKVVYNK